MTEKDVAEVMEEETIETFEFTDEEGQDHCFVVESRFKVGKDDYVALLEVDPSIFAEEEEECDCDHVTTITPTMKSATATMIMMQERKTKNRISSWLKLLQMKTGKSISRFLLMKSLKRQGLPMKHWKHNQRK